jgi:hypothetical protein
VEKARFSVVGTNDYGISAAATGQPDIGQVRFGEMLETGYR